jgi:hypothetical protein
MRDLVTNILAVCTESLLDPQPTPQVGASSACFYAEQKYEESHAS